MGTTDFLLNCFVLGDNEDTAFTVEISKDKNVSILKDEIKKKKGRLLSHVDASDLDLWKVCLPLDNPAQAASKRALFDNQQEVAFIVGW